MAEGNIYRLITLVILLITQVVAWLASSPKTPVDRKYILNLFASYAIAVQWFGFIHAGGYFGNARTEKYLDLIGSFTFLTTLAWSLYLVPAKKIQLRNIILSVMVAIWASRLGWFAFATILNSDGTDSKYSYLMKSLPLFLVAWTLQGMLVFFQLLPVLMLNLSTEVRKLGVLDFIGFPMWVFGFIFEAVADYQESAFTAENREMFISSGLWSISRHPNYFGEILLWIGIALSAFGGLGVRKRAVYVFLSPIFVTFLLIFVSGIPLLEEEADKKYGYNDLYQEYKSQTPVLVPFIGRAGDAMF